MRLKSLIPWLCVLASLLGAAWMYTENQKKEQELTVLRDASQQVQKLRTEIEEAKVNRTQTESDEITRLRKDNEELLRLRNEVRQLRGDKQQLNSQLQTAQTQVQGAQAQMEALRAVPVQPVAPGQPNPAGQPGVPGRPGAAPASPEQANTLTCQNNLRTIQGAKQQWATEQQKPASALMTTADLMPYLKGSAMPACPAGGVYTLNPVAVPPFCNIPGHNVGR
jgi:DNA repair exonuclease SbcCD ATPase subunit